MVEVVNENLQPRTVGGLRVGPVPDLDGTIPRTRRQAMGSSFSFMHDFVVDRWRMLGEESTPQVTEEEFKEIVGDRDIRFWPGITRRQLERQVAEHDFAQTDAQFQQYPLAQMGASFLPLFYDPVTAATLPLGANNMLRAGAANTFRQFALQSTVAGAKISAGTTPLEAAAQLQQTGRLDPTILAAQATIPFAIAPGLAGLGKLFRKFGPRADVDGQLADTLGITSVRGLTPDEAARLANDIGHLRPPRVQLLSGDNQPPLRRLNEAFRGYEGGHRAWVRDLSAGRASARQYAQDTLGVDPDAPALRDALIAMQDRSAQTHMATPERTLRVNDAVNRFRAGSRDEGIVQTLLDEGLVLPRVRVVDGELRPTGEFSLSETGRILDDALRDPSVPANRAILDAVNREGPVALDRVALERGVDLDPDTNLRASMNRIAADELSDAELIRALELAGLETRPLDGPTPTRPVEPRGEGTQPTAARATDTPFDGDEAAMAAELRRIGVDPEEVAAPKRRFLEAINGCLRA